MPYSWKQAARLVAIVAFALFFLRNPFLDADISSELNELDMALSGADASVDHWADPVTPTQTDANQWLCESGCSSCACPQRWWFDAEYLLLWTNGDRVPPLVSTNLTLPPRSEAGVLGVGDTEVLVGGPIDEGGRSGVSLTAGHWLDDCRCWGLQATWFYAGDPFDELNDSWSSPGNPVLARPFLNVGSGLEDSQLVAFPNVLAGTVRVATSSDLRSAEALLSMNWLQGCRGRVDLLGGYRYFRFREGVLVQENLVSTDPGGFVPVGTTIDLFDQFDTSNSFHGGEIGLLTSLSAAASYSTWQPNWESGTCVVALR